MTIHQHTMGRLREWIQYTIEPTTPGNIVNYLGKVTSMSRRERYDMVQWLIDTHRIDAI